MKPFFPYSITSILSKVRHSNPRMGWGGGTLIFSYIRRFWLFYSRGGGQNFEFRYFGGFQKNEYSFGYEDFVDVFGVITKLGYN